MESTDVKAHRCVECTLLRCDHAGGTCEECLSNKAQQPAVVKWNPGWWGGDGKQPTEMPQYIVDAAGATTYGRAGK